jgi:hypothetical protein
LLPHPTNKTDYRLKNKHSKSPKNHYT